MGNDSNYHYNCVRCANCCKESVEVSLSKRDILNWKRDERKNYLKYVQINPKSISPYFLEAMSEKKREKLIKFVLENHTYIGEGRGFNIDRPFFKLDWSNRPILNPKSFEIILEGMKMGLNYTIITEMSDDCPFLRGNICFIQELKPEGCRKFPFNKKNELRLDDFTLEKCKGIKKI